MIGRIGTKENQKEGLAANAFLLRSCVQPGLDYFSQLWSPREQQYITRLEAVQKKEKKKNAVNTGNCVLPDLRV